MKIGVLGASGRMGQALISAIDEQPQLVVAAAVVSDQSTQLGQPLTATLSYQSRAQIGPDQVDVWVDFSLPTALAENLRLALQQRTPMVVCTTGLSAEEHSLLTAAAAQIPLLYAANTSVGVALLQQLTELASAALPQADIEIIEAHHRHKRDAPSGTAVILAEYAARGRTSSLAQLSAGIRTDGERQPGSIGFASIRAGDIIGEHTVLLAQLGERIELTHKVSDRRVFADGALRAARWLLEQPAGYYKLTDMLDLRATFDRLLQHH
jgi:4-hydroxy-tetrahydrodipicolinate reductase